MTAGGMEGEGEAAGTSSAAALGDTATAETGFFFLLTFLLFTLFLSTEREGGGEAVEAVEAGECDAGGSADGDGVSECSGRSSAATSAASPTCEPGGPATEAESGGGETVSGRASE